MRNIRIKVIHDVDCQDCGGYGERDVATNKERKAGIEKFEECDHCKGSGTLTIAHYMSIEDLAKALKEQE